MPITSRRIYSRYRMRIPDIAWMSWAGSRLGFVHEMSAGGLGLELDSDALPPGQTFVGELHYFDLKHAMAMAIRHHQPSFIGVQFEFDSIADLEHVRRIILPFRYGAAQAFMDARGLKDPSDLPRDFQCDGVLPFTLDLGSDANQIKIDMAFDRIAARFVHSQGTYRTFHNLEPGGTIGGLRETSQPDRSILRAAFGFLWGHSAGEASTVPGTIATSLGRFLLESTQTDTMLRVSA